MHKNSVLVPIRLRVVRFGGLFVLWITTTILMIRNHVFDPYDPSRQGTERYGHNSDSALEVAVTLTIAELVVLLAILRLGSYRHSWRRSSLALLVFVPWAAFSGLMAMHAGGIMAMHLLWTLAIVAILLLCLVWSIVGAARTR